MKRLRTLIYLVLAIPWLVQSARLPVAQAAGWKKVTLHRESSLITDSNIFTQVQKLTASDGAANDSLGYALSVSGDTLVVGAYNATVGPNPKQGAAYVYYYNAGSKDWEFFKKLTASDGAANDEFGFSVALDGDTLVIGADTASVSGHAHQGAAYVFGRSQGGADNWGEVRKLTSSDGAQGDDFGVSVAVNTDSIVVGADYADVLNVGDDQGAAYVYSRNQGGQDNWGQTKKLVASDGAPSDSFGYAVTINADTAVIGSYMATITTHQDQGAAYIFYRDTGGSDNWGEFKKLTRQTGTAEDLFGVSVALDGDNLVVGASGVGGFHAGAAYVFNRNQNGLDAWGEVATLDAPDAADFDDFGVSVSILGNQAIVGADNSHVDGVSPRGAAYVFEQNTGGANQWGFTGKLISNDGVNLDSMGRSVALNGEFYIAGVPGAKIGFNTDQGAAYIFFNFPYGLFLPIVTR
jgi:hypothetical protein